MASPDEWFNSALHSFRARSLPAGKLLDLGFAPRVPVDGWLVAPVMMNQSVLRKAVEKHCLDTLAFVNLPSRVSSPVMIFDSHTHPGSFVLVTDLVIGDKPAVLAIHKTHTRNSGSFNAVRSIHLRDLYQIRLWLEDGLLRFENKEKRQAILQDSAPCN